MDTVYSSFEDLPLSLCANDVANILGISRSGAYTLMRSKNFPTIMIGKRMVVPKHKLIEWIDQQAAV